MDRNRFKIGLLADGTELPAWQAALVANLIASRFGSLGAFIVGLREGTATRKNSRESLLYDLFWSRASGRFSPSANACRIVSVSETLAAARPEILDLPLSRPAREPASTLAQIHAQDLDILFSLMDDPPLDVLAPLARYGVWFFCHDNLPQYHANGHAVGTWEALRHLPVIRSAVQIRRTGLEKDSVVYETISGFNSASVASSRNEHLWKLAFSLPRALQRLAGLSGHASLCSLPSVERRQPENQADRRSYLTNRNLALPLLSYATWRVRMKIQRLHFKERWVLLFNVQDSDKQLPIQPTAFASLHPPKGRFWADPFVVYRDRRHFVFFEDASVDSGHGHIAAMEMRGDGVFTDPRPVIQRPYHLSYPFTFEWNGDLYLIPESADNRTIEVYRCKVFPYEWEFEQNLISDISAYDTTLLEHHGRWWLFANIKTHPASSSWDELCIFYAPSPLSKNWIPHPMNPVISDATRARPAGRIFAEEGQLYRPSQDSSYRYGYGLNINRITELSPTSYREEIVQAVHPNWKPSIKAVHTLNKAHRLAMMDAIERYKA